jgi:hypothetical protein
MATYDWGIMSALILRTLQQMFNLARRGALDASKFRKFADVLKWTPKQLEEAIRIMARTYKSGGKVIKGAPMGGGTGIGTEILGETLAGLSEADAVLASQLARDIINEISSAVLSQLALDAATAAVGGSILSAIGAWIWAHPWVALIVGVSLVGGAIYASSTSSTATGPCPPQIDRLQKCPWTPEGYTVNPCKPGWCYDGGPQGSLACKQEKSVPHSGRTYTNDLVCAEGYEGVRDRCTNVIVECRSLTSLKPWWVFW